jgi:hypothetical protein
MTSAIDRSTLLNRINELLLLIESAGTALDQINEAFYGTITVIRCARGPGSVHEAQLLNAMTRAGEDKSGYWSYRVLQHVAPTVRGSLRALKADVEQGLIGSVALQASGAVLGDFLGLAKVALSNGGQPELNVASVLAAAAFEDTLRRLAEVKAGLTDRPKLEDVIGRLKSAGVLVGASVATANGYLKFRNDSLHADWKNMTPDVVAGCMAFVEGLLQQHFS